MPPSSVAPPNIYRFLPSLHCFVRGVRRDGAARGGPELPACDLPSSNVFAHVLYVFMDVAKGSTNGPLQCWATLFRVRPRVQADCERPRPAGFLSEYGWWCKLTRMPPTKVGKLAPVTLGHMRSQGCRDLGVFFWSIAIPAVAITAQS